MRSAKIVNFILYCMIFTACFNDGINSKNNADLIDISTLVKQTQGPIDLLPIIRELTDIQFYLEGNDSILETTDPIDFIELNGIKSIFQDPFSDSDTGLIKYRNVELIKKFHVVRKDGKPEPRPSANILQLTFKNNESAQKWYGIYDKSLTKEIIKSKPKTNLWIMKNNIFFVQTYHTPKRDYIDLLSETLTRKINAQTTHINKKQSTK